MNSSSHVHSTKMVAFVQLGLTFFVMMSKGEKTVEPSFLGRKEIGTTLLLRILTTSERESINFKKLHNG
jgi:hypothetical protein